MTLFPAASSGTTCHHVAATVKLDSSHDFNELKEVHFCLDLTCKYTKAGVIGNRSHVLHKILDSAFRTHF